MYYYTETNYIDHDSLRTAGGKGRDDYFEVLRRVGLERIRIPTVKDSPELSGFRRLAAEKKLRSVWREALSGLKKGDAVFLHSPVSEKFIGYPGIIEDIHRRGCKVVNIVFDLETFFKSDYRRLAAIKHAADRWTEAHIFRTSDLLICHNSRMKEKLISLNVDEEKIICLDVMDYLRDERDFGNTDCFSLEKPVVFCGNLEPSKSGFVYELGDIDLYGSEIDLYGPGYTGRGNEAIRYKGVYKALELMDIMEGSFGLVWDGDSVVTCKGACGEYLRFNNPHKMSHYLASGMPVLVWSEAAMAEFVLNEGCGLTIDSLQQIPSVLSAIDKAKYDEMKKNAQRVGLQMRNGQHIRNAAETAIRMLEEMR